MVRVRGALVMNGLRQHGFGQALPVCTKLKVGRVCDIMCMQRAARVIMSIIIIIHQQKYRGTWPLVILMNVPSKAIH